MKSGIYRIELGNGHFYIGSAVDLVKRESGHRAQLKRGDHGNKFVQRCWDKYGVFEFTVVEECAKDDLLVREQFHIDQHRDNSKMTNICLTVGAGRLGLLHSSETKAKMSRAKRGHTVSAASRTKISTTLTGRVFSAEHRANIATAAKRRWTTTSL